MVELLGEADENAFGAPDVAEAIGIFVLDHVADEHGAALAEPGQRIVDVLHGEHDTQIAESVDRGVAVVRGYWRREESGHLQSTVTVRGAHHGDLYAHVAQSSDAVRPITFDKSAAPVATPARMAPTPGPPSPHSPSKGARPSGSRPSSVKNAMAASRSSTTM